MRKINRLVREILEENKEIAEISMVEREKKKNIKDLLPTDEILIITGVRRCGKSYLLISLLKELEGNILYINFEDDRFLGFTTADLEKVYNSYIEIMNPKGDIYFLLDEIQGVEGWEKWVRRMYDSRKLRFILTGSNASLLSPEIATTLGGRSIQMELFPFSFKEFLSAKEFSPRYFTDSEISRIKHFLNEYLESGAFPKISLKEKDFEKASILSSYTDTIIYKDIISRFEIRDVENFKQFTNYLVTNIGSPISYYKLKNLFRIGVETVKNYLFYLETAFIVFNIPIFSYKVKEQLQYPRKIYCIDNGIVTNFSFRFMENKGKLMENLVFVELKRRGKEIYYWKSRQQEEVDFVVKDGLKVKELIQVCYDIEDKNTKKREVKALLKAMKEFNLKEGLIITWDLEDEEEVNGRKIIRYTPLWKWLISK